MSIGVCLITAGLAAPSALGDLLRRCGITVWTPTSPDADDGHIYDAAVCVVIDMPGETGLRTLQLLRSYSINTPALLIVDPGLERAFQGLNGEGLLSVLPRGADMHGAMRWLEVVCQARNEIVCVADGNRHELMHA